MSGHGIMSGHSANPISLHKKNKGWTSRTLSIPHSHSPTSDRDIRPKLAPVSRYWTKLIRGHFQFLDFWSISHK